MLNSHIIDDIPELAALPESVDYIDIRAVESSKSLREFTAASLSYMPGWMLFLYRIREFFVRLLGERQEEIPSRDVIPPEQLAFTPGDMATFFQVKAAEEDRFWLAEARDDMIAGCYGVIREPLEDGTNRFHIITTASYLKWTARIYFAVICPFHHLVVNAMARHAIKA